MLQPQLGQMQTLGPAPLLTVGTIMVPMPPLATTTSMVLLLPMALLATAATLGLMVLMPPISMAATVVPTRLITMAVTPTAPMAQLVVTVVALQPMPPPAFVTAVSYWFDVKQRGTKSRWQVSLANVKLVESDAMSLASRQSAGLANRRQL